MAGLNGFLWVEQGKGEPVGPPIKFDHWAADDDMRSEAHKRLAKKVLLGLRANAIQYIGTEPIGGGTSISTIQPCWV